MQARQTIKKVIAVYGFGQMQISEHGSELFKPQCMPRWFLSALEEALLELSNSDFEHLSSKTGYIFEGYDGFIHAVTFHYFNATHVRWSVLDDIPKCVRVTKFEELQKVLSNLPIF